MTTYTVEKAKTQLEGLIAQTEQAHAPIIIARKHKNAVLLAEDDWNSMQETLYLLSIPGMRESIIEGMKTPTEACDEKLDR